MNEHILHKPSRAGVFRFPDDRAGIVVAAARNAGLRVLEADVGQSDNRAGVLSLFGRTWNFPDWYGINLDALHDCLTDPDWQPAAGYALVISGLDRLRAAHPDDFLALIEVFRSVAELRGESGRPFWVLLDTTAPDIPPLPDA